MGEKVIRSGAQRLTILAGLCLVVVGIGAASWWLLYARPQQQDAEALRQREVCRGRIDKLVLACRVFRDGEGRGQRYPFDWSELLRSGQIDTAELRCPLDSRSGEPISYTYLGDKPMLVSAREFVLAYETFHNHKHYKPPGHMVAFADQRIVWVTTQQLQAILRKQSGGLDR